MGGGPLKFAQESRELIVDRVAGLVGGEVATDGTAYESHIAEDIEEFVAGGLILPLEGTQLKEAEVRSVAVLYTELVSQFVEVGLRHDAVVDDESVGEVAATDEGHLQKGCYLADKDEGAGRSEVGREASEIVERGRLRCDEFAVVEVDGSFDGEARRRRAGSRIGLGRRLDAEPAARLLVVILYGFLNGEVVAGFVLLEEAYAVNLLHIEAAAAVEDGKFGTIDLNEAVVDATSIEGGHGVFYRGDANIFVVGMCDYGAARGVDYIFGKGRDDGFAGEVNALNLQTGAGRGGKEGDREFEAGVKAFAAEGKRS